MKVRCNKMVITRKDMETKEIEVPGFRKILRNTKNPDYKELKIYIKNGWIPVDPEDDERELQKAKKRKINAKKNKERRPNYDKMEEKIKKLKDSQKILEEFYKRKAIKNNYINVLKWYNDEMKKKQNKADTTPPKTEKETKTEDKQVK